MEGKRPRRPMIGMIDNLKEESYVRIKRKAEDKVAWRSSMPKICLRAEN